MTALPDFSPIGATATSGDLTPPSQSIDTPVFHFSITSGEDIFQDNIALLDTPQEHEIHTIFGSCLALASVCGIIKTQPQAKQKAAKNIKAKSVKDQKFAVAAHKAKSVLKKKELLTQQHIHFKSSLTMLTTAILDLSSTESRAKSGSFTPSGQLTTTSVTSFSTNSIKDMIQDNSVLLATLQEHKIHAPPGPCPARAGVCGTTRAQVQAKRKAAKDAKVKAIEERKFTMAACKAEAVANKKEWLISSAKAKVAKAGSRVDKLRAELTEATKGAAVRTLPGHGTDPAVLISPHFHSHKKCNRITGSPSSGNSLAVCSQLSPQWLDCAFLFAFLFIASQFQESSFPCSFFTRVTFQKFLFAGSMFLQKQVLFLPLPPKT
jgi:hypothetical protein